MSERHALGRERAASLSAICNLTPVQKCQPDYMRSRRRLRHREGSGEGTKPVPERSRWRRRRNSAEGASGGSGEAKAPQSGGSAKPETAPARYEPVAAEAKRCRNGAVPERSRCRSERSISKGRKAATAFSSQVRAAPREERAGQPATSVRLRAETAPAKVRSRCRNEAVPGARKTDGRGSGRADRSSPLFPPFGRAVGRYRWHRIYRRADGAFSDVDHSARMINHRYQSYIFPPKKAGGR